MTQVAISEEWKLIPKSRYEVSSNGQVKNSLSGRILKPRLHSHGYARVNIGAKREEYIHRLVCSAFNGDCPDGYECDHINHVRNDNRSLNLRWVTPSENKQNRRFSHGEKHSQAKLSASHVIEIRKLFAKQKNSEISKRFSVSRRTIADIRNGVTWK